MSHYFKIVRAACQCGGTQAWMKLRISGDGVVGEMVGCICHNSLPPDAKVIGDYLDRPYASDPMPLFNEVELQQWKRRNAVRHLGSEVYRRPPDL